MKVIQLFVLFFLVSNSVNAQMEDAWVFFKDKPNQQTYLDSPELMLSVRSIERKQRHNVPIDSRDVPIESSYYTGIQNAEGITIKAKSKWMNALHIQGSFEEISALLEMTFVARIEFANKSIGTVEKSTIFSSVNKQHDKLDIQVDYEYGVTRNQVEMLGLNVLHENDFTGEGMLIALMDAGFPNVDVYEAFSRMRNNGQILGGYDFVNRSDNFLTGHYHGMAVLSTIAGYVENSFVGTAPDADFYLFITEDDSQESPLEESLWVEAAERADSLGVDIINTSLGYTVFDDVTYNYSNDDLDGNTTFISRGAELAFTRGMMVVNSAGNEGNDPWHFVSAPADATHVLSIGAVNADKIIAPFSSFGPTADGRIKPDVLAQGWGVYIVRPNGTIGTSSGTSFSSPVIAGTIACLWDAFPELTNQELFNFIQESGHLFENPTDQEGYGIPNFAELFDKLVDIYFDDSVDNISVYPNPGVDQINIKISETASNLEVTLFNELGQKVIQHEINPTDLRFSIGHLNNGLYFGSLKIDDKKQFFKILKINEK